MHSSWRVLLAAAALAAAAPGGAARAQAPAAVAAPPESTAIAARLDALLRRYHELEKFNGLALVARDGQVLFQNGYGFANFEHAVPNSPATKLWLGSVTKVFTATAVMRLVDQGKIALDDRVSTWLPWYRRDTADRITVRHLLTHTSGLPDYMHLPGTGREGFRQQAGEQIIDVVSFAQQWCSADLQWEPGAQWGYSNSGYVLLGAIVEQVTGLAFEPALRALVLDPLGMAGTGDLAMRPRAVIEGLATGYEREGDQLLTRRAWNVSTAYGAGAMYSTLADLLRFDRGLEDPAFLSDAARAAMFQAGPGNWGCGWGVRRLPIGPGGLERLVVDHEGFIYWTITQIWRVPEDGLFVVLSNNTGDAPVRAMFQGIADLLHGREPAWPKPSAARAVQELAFQKGPEVALERYRELQRAQPDGYEFEEQGLNLLGYDLLRAGWPDAATAIFRFVTQTWPQSANAWDSYGEALAAAGDPQAAIAAYRKSLELDPSNRNAAERLAELQTP